MRMHAQAHISGHISGQVPIQAGSFSDLSHPNGNSVPSQMQHLGGLHMDSDFEQTRQRMRDFIYQRISRGKQVTPLTVPKVQEMARRLEEFLYKNASTKEEYINMNTLEQRLQICFRTASRNQQLAQSISSSSVGTMMPTPGMTHRRNSNSTVSSSAGNSMIPVSINECNTGMVDTINTRRLLSTSNGSTAGVSFSASDGSISNGHQHSPANISMGSGVNGPIPSIGFQRTASQMMPTPGLSNTNGNSEPFNSACIKSTNLIRPQQTKQYAGGHNSRILHNLGGQMGSGLRSTLQQYGFPNDTPVGALGSTVTNVQSVHSPVPSEGHPTVSSYGCSPASIRPSTSHLDNQQHLMQSTLPQQMIHMTGDGYGSNISDLSGPEKLCGPRMPVGSTVNDQNLNQTSDQSSTMAFQSHQASKLPQQELHQRSQRVQQQLIQHQPNHEGWDHNLLFRGGEHGQSRVNHSLGSQPIEEHEMDSHGKFQYSNIAEQLQLSELQNQVQQTTTVEGQSRGSQLIWHPSGQEEFCSPLSQISMQQVENQQLQLVDSQNNNGCTTAGGNSQSVLHGQWRSQSQERFHIPGDSSRENHVQEEFRRRITGQDEAQLPHLSSNGPITSHTSASRLHSTPKASNSSAFSRENAIPPSCMQQIKWLLFLQHARRCSAPEGKCLDANCIKAQQFLKHTEGCPLDQCSYPRCHATKVLIQHVRKCQSPVCPVCVPFHCYSQTHIKPRICPSSDQDFKNSTNGSQKGSDAEDAAQLTMSTSALTVEPSKDLQSTVKRIKVEHSSPSPILNNERPPVPVPAISQPHASQDAHSQIYQQLDIPINVKCEITEVKRGSSVSTNKETPLFCEIKKDTVEDADNMMLDNESMFANGPVGLVKQEDKKDIDSTKQQIDHEMTTVSSEQSSETKSGKPKIQGVSLTELFTPDEIRKHIIGLRQWVGQSKAKAERNQAMENSMSENSCQLCAVEKLAFEPPLIYCTSCGARIKRNAMYYTTGSGDTRSCFCSPCYNEPRGDAIQVDGKPVQKARMEKKRNDEETEEWWVQCDKCEAWQHQICALFNGRRNEGGQAEYTCPNCYVSEIERGERKPLPQSAVLGAKDLPRTVLSDHIEHRLFRRLRQERQERARLQGKNFDEVPGAEALVVRVVSSVDKKLEVKQRFLEIFQEENYPTEFPYKSKVVLLFQKIEGVEVCLFGMYVQEFGSECMLPNQRRVYLSYLDSVKYFRPEIKTVTGEALRTFVYHEILIAYLEYCKKRGFTSCYIWACPPLKGEDYILYCHPEIQKTPKSDKLREWYLSMLRKASKENIVVELTNLYDHFFISTGECKAKVTAARLPYFDGDYWPGAAEDMINQLLQEEDGRKQHKRGKIKKIITKRALKAAGQTDLSGNASKDILLMQKLGETISPMKEDFIMVHLQHACSHCCHLMVSGTRWVCNQCKKFHLCDKCYEAEQKLEERDRHPINSRDKHRLHPVEVNDVPEDTKDKDDILESEFFDTRQAFLSLCQGNHYQYDTLRRAKHSSMMVLYHLHNPTAPAFVTTCNICHNDIEAGQGWRCEICADYDLCNSCYQKDGGVDHPHRLTNHPSLVDRDAQNKEARQLRVLQLRKMLDLLVHAASCSYASNCQYPNCRKVKGLFRHGFTCKIRASRGCGLCKRMWNILQLHARACKEIGCKVPRCEDLKEHLRRLQQQAESRRRAAVNEMMRQRAAEVAGNSG